MLYYFFSLYMVRLHLMNAYYGVNGFFINHHCKVLVWVLLYSQRRSIYFKMVGLIIHIFRAQHSLIHDELDVACLLRSNGKKEKKKKVLGVDIEETKWNPSLLSLRNVLIEYYYILILSTETVRFYIPGGFVLHSASDVTN